MRRHRGYIPFEDIMSRTGTYFGFRIGQIVLWEGRRVKILGWWKPGRIVVTGGHIVYRRGIKKVR